MPAYSGANIATLCATISFTLGGIFLWYRVLPNHFRDLGATDAQVGLAFMLISFAYRGPQVIGGWLADRWSRRMIVVVGTLLMGPLYAAAALAQTWPALLACLCACWVLGALQWPALLSLLAESAPPDRRGRALGWLDFSSILGQTFGPLAGAAVLAASWGDIRHLFLITGAVYTVMGLARLFLLQNVSSRESEPEPAVGPARAGVLLTALVMATAGFMSFYLIWDGPFASMYLEDAYALSKPAINLNAMIGGLLTMAAALASGVLVDRLGAARYAAIGFVGMAAVAAPFVIGGMGRRGEGWPYGPGYALVALSTLPVEAYFLSYQRIITSIGPAKRRSFFVGLFGTTVGLASGVVNYVGGVLYRDGGYAAVMTVAVGACAAGLVTALALWRMHNKRAAPALETP